MFLAVLHHVVEGGDLDGLEFVVHIVFRPEVAVAVLHPFEIGNRNATGIGQNVRDYKHAAVKQDVVCRRRGGTVGALGQDSSLDAAGIPAVDHAFGGGGQ